jgi:acetyl-CoA carboxylase biotin carboxyl carrier protein
MTVTSVRFMSPPHDRRQERSIMAKTPAAKAPKAAAPSSTIDTDLVRAIADLLNETNVGEIEVSKGDLSIRVAKAGPAQVMQQAPMMQAAPLAAGAAVAPPVTGAPVAKPVASAASHPGAVKSPMVGTAYRKPTPESKNFVEVGSTVKVGDKLMLIEAMKTFNDIVSTAAGTVTTVLIEDGQPVEFGQPLFIIE